MVVESADFSLCVNNSFFLYHYISNQSKDECEYLIELAKPHMEKSTVVDSATGQSKDSRFAQSQAVFE